MNKAKKQGTEWETKIKLNALGRGFDAWRIAEGGSNDEGDVMIKTPGGYKVVVEAKHRANLNVHQHLAKASGKTDYDTVVMWKKLRRKEGNSRRVSDGPPVVVMGEDLFFALLERIDNEL